MSNDRRFIDIDNLPANIKYAETFLTDGDKEKIIEIKNTYTVKNSSEETKCIIEGKLINKEKYYDTIRDDDGSIISSSTRMTITLENMPPIITLYCDFKDIIIGENTVIEFLKHSQLTLSCYPTSEKKQDISDDSEIKKRKLMSWEVDIYVPFLIFKFRTPLFSWRVTLYSILAFFFISLIFLNQIINFFDIYAYYLLAAYSVIHLFSYIKYNLKLWLSILKLMTKKTVIVQRFVLRDKYLSSGKFKGGILIGNRVYHCNTIQYEKVNPGDYVEVIQLDDCITTLEVKVLKKSKAMV